MVLQQGKLTFRETFKAVEQGLTDHESEDGVAQKLQALVIGLGRHLLGHRGLGFVRAGTMRHGTGQQSAVREPISECALEFVQADCTVTSGPIAAWPAWRALGPLARCS